MVSNETYNNALSELINGNSFSAEKILEPVLQSNNRASQSIYLYGIVNLFLDNIDFGMELIERSYKIKTWIKDDISFIPGFEEIILKLLYEKPKNEWLNYQYLRYKWRLMGMDYDRLIEELLDISVETPIFVEVGANDGVFDDPLHKWVHKLRGVLIEPQPDAFQRLLNTYKNHENLIFENCAVSNEDDEVELYVSDSNDSGTLASLIPERNSLKFANDTRTIRVKCRSFDAIVNSADISNIDILQIDTEGSEWQIIKNIDLDYYKIKILNLEFYCLPVKERVLLLQYLEERNYIYRFDGMNLIVSKNGVFSNTIVSSRW